ncbi:MAG: ATP-dependent zinc metalloprotease FtsH [Proteobacteria bacterium]|nr:ATP-dependent zinc metalloprotease FtsH [Pseudomonadota bacterium]
MEKKTQLSIWYFVLAMLLVLFLQSLWTESATVENIPYSEFRQYLEDGLIAEVVVSETTVRGTLRDVGDGPREVVAVRVEPGLADDLDQYGVEYSGKFDSNFLSNILSWIVPVLIFFGLYMFVMRRLFDRGGFGGGGGGSFMSVGQSKAKVYMETAVKVTFDDVAGVDEAKLELQEVVAFLKNPEIYGRLGGRVPKGVLLVGPPGTGKTLLARAVAGEAGVPFFSINGSEFVEMFVGVGAARVRDLFDQARKKAPAIIFIDELDALGRARGLSPMGGGGHDEKEQTLNQLLAEMDGFDPSTRLILLSATNRPEILDPALLRAGRFDRQVLVDRPDKAGRVAILNIHLKKIRLAGDGDLEMLASLTPGFTGADLANLANEAALLATRRGGEDVTMADFDAAIERIIAGLEKKNRLLNPLERKVVAHHEMGHALVSLSLGGVEKVHKVSIIPRGIGSLGYTIQRPTEERYLMTREELENKMAVLLGGRASERLIFDHLSTGAADDLARATDIARSMVTRYGMEEKLGHVTYDTEPRTFLDVQQRPTMLSRQYSEDTAREIDCAVRDILDAAYAKALGILTRRRADLEKGAAVLLEKETLTEDELTAVVGGTESPAG